MKETQTRWTPGPWYAVGTNVYRRPKEELYEFGGDVAGDKPVAIACRGWQEGGFPVDANAHLIAAAPLMYEALEHIEEYWNRDQNETAMADALWHIIETAGEALRTARGETQANTQDATAKEQQS